MAVSKLAKQWLPVNNYTPGRQYGITHFTFHHMAGRLGLEQCQSILQGSGVSATYGIDALGNIAAFLDEGVCPWSDGNWESNQTGVSVEISNDGGADWHISDAALEAACKLCADVLKRYGLPPTPETIRYHQQCCPTACPGDYVIRIFHDTVIPKVQWYYEHGAAEPAPPKPESPKFDFFQDEHEDTYCMVRGSKTQAIGWVLDNDGLYRWFDPAKNKHGKYGRAPKGWYKHSNRYRYYFWYKGGGTIAIGKQAIGDQTYYFDGQGHQLTGWVDIGGMFHYFAPEKGGASPKGWYKHSNGHTYYFWYKEGGTFAIGKQAIGDDTYYFNDLGHQLTGWVDIGGVFHYFAPEKKGAAPKGWYNHENGERYYFWYKGGGTFAVGDQVIGDKTYKFNELGHLVK